MHLPSINFKILPIAAILFSASAAHADIMVYTSQSAYLAAVGNTGVDTFDDLVVDSYDAPLSRSAGAYSYTADTVGVSPFLFGAGGTADHWLSTDVRTDGIAFSNFSSVIHGAGGFFFGSDIFGDYATSSGATLTASNINGEVATYNLISPTQSSFLGFVSSSSLQQMTVSVNDQVGLWPTVNNLQLSVVAAVPEPETYGMLLAGLALIGGIARRRKASVASVDMSRLTIAQPAIA